MILKANFLSDMNTYVFTLPKGDYTLNASVVTFERPTEVQTSDISGICIVTSSTVISHYEPPGMEQATLSVESFNEQKEQLLAKVNIDSYGDFEFNDIDDEFAYRKFILNWTPINRIVTTLSDPIEFDISTGIVSTGNPFISSLYVVERITDNSTADCSIYTYNRAGAIVSIVRETFSELGMTYNGNTTYGATKNSMTWGHSNNRFDLQYTMAFGTYVSFLGDYARSGINKGTLESMNALNKHDKETISSKITLLFAAHHTHDAGTFDFGELYAKLTSIKTKVKQLDCKVRADNDKSVLLFTINNTIDLVNEFLYHQMMIKEVPDIIHQVNNDDDNV